MLCSLHFHIHKYVWIYIHTYIHFRHIHTQFYCCLKSFYTEFVVLLVFFFIIRVSLFLYTLMQVRFIRVEILYKRMLKVKKKQTKQSIIRIYTEGFVHSTIFTTLMLVHTNEKIKNYPTKHIYGGRKIKKKNK